MVSRKTKFCMTGALLLLLLGGCESSEVPTAIEIGNGPSFSMRGSGRLASFTVSGPLSGEKIAYSCGTRLLTCPGVASAVWQIQASQGYFDGKVVNGLQLVYGHVPEGYIQTMPSQTQPPPPLSSDVIYAFFAETSGAAVATGSFYVDKGGDVEAVQTDLCLMLKSGQWARVNCKTNAPYQEPVDIERYVQEHRISQ
jgi:hypothetical protein